MSENYENVLKALKGLTQAELKDVFAIVSTDSADKTETEATVIKKSKALCPYCGSHSVIRYGKKHGKQRFYCKECKRTFLSTTNTIMSNSHYGKNVWIAIFNDLIEGHAIVYSEKRLRISHDAIFNIRHKILLSIQSVLLKNPTILREVSELDETFVLDCYKGKRLPGSIRRKARKHGAKAQKRGISSEYVCICTGVQRGGAPLIKAINRAKPSAEELLTVFQGHIGSGVLLLTDGLRSYNVLNKTADCIIKNVKSEKSSFYNLNTVNNLHSFIKKRYIFYRGVATKYINRYCAALTIAYRKNEKVINYVKTQLFDTGNTKRIFHSSDVKNYGILTL